VSESIAHEVIRCQLRIPSKVGFTQSSSRAIFLYNWLISSKYRQVGSTNLSPYDGSNGAMTLYSPDSNVIFPVFKLIMAWLSNAQSKPSNTGYGVVPSTISITSKSSLLRTPSSSTVTPFSLEIGRTLCWFASFS
jgi:hypothetical protein